MPVEIQTVPTQITCKYCGSPAVIKFGTYKGVQRFYCKSCKRKFKADDAVYDMQKPADYVSTALSLYYSGASITDIRNTLKAQYGYYPSKSVIFWWVNKYTAIAAKQFQDEHPPKLGDVWIADETVLDMDKGVKVWFWDIIDEKTRFLIASRASLSRTTRDAQLLIDRAIKRAGKAPKEVKTDKLASYVDVNYGKGAEHVQGGPFKFKWTGESTSEIERFHGTIKDRTKVMRAFRDLETLHTFMDGYLTFYNYFKPHESLNGETPAEAAGVHYSIHNWKDLVCLPAPKAERAQGEAPTVSMQDARTGKTVRLAPLSPVRSRAPHISELKPKASRKPTKPSNAVFSRDSMLSRHSIGKGSHRVAQGKRGRGIIL